MGMVLTEAVEAIGGLKALDRPAAAISGGIARLFKAGGPVGRQVENALHGVWLGHPLHPAIIAVPVGGFSALAVLDALEGPGGNRRLAPGADALLTIGLGGAWAAAVTGWTDWHKTDGAAKRVGLVHAALNGVGIAFYVASLAARRGGRRGRGRQLAAAGFAISTSAAYLGGELAYKYRIGVDHSDADKALPGQWTDVAAVGDLAEGEPCRVEAAGTDVLLLRQGRRVYALGETCPHLGGPLAEGEVRDGGIVCPWHGSRFALEDGRVLDGPATAPTPCFATRVRKGQVQVRYEG